MLKKALRAICQEHQGKVTDKWSVYLDEYERMFHGFRDSTLRLLEIGVQNGGSLELWAKYFDNAASIVGCDIESECSKLEFNDPRIKVIVGDVTSSKTQRDILAVCPKFDIIIDDGSHRSNDIVTTFSRYFPCLDDGGVFIVEDLHCSYWRQYEGGLFDPFSSISFFKRLVDIIGYEHWGVEKARVSLFKGFISKYNCEIDEESLQHIHSIEFINSMCVIRKAAPECNQLGIRVVSGVEEVVEQGLRLKYAPIPDETGNEWSTRSLPPEEELVERLRAGEKMEQEVVRLNRSLIGCNEQIARLIDQLDKTNRRVTALSCELEEATDQVSDLKMQLSEKQSHLSEVVVALEDKEKQIKAGNTLKKKLVSRLRQIQTSSAWQIVQPLVKIESRIPKFMRLVASVGKLTWWAASFNLFTRLRLRQRGKRLIALGVFDEEWYLQNNVDVLIEGVQPVIHWLNWGWRHGIKPNPLFDPAWYLKINPDVALSGANPLEHYLDRGAREGRDPCTAFSTRQYVATHNGVDFELINPLVHCIGLGKAEEFLEMERSSNVRKVVRYNATRNDIDLVRSSGMFDVSYYINMYPDIPQSGIDPIRHYLEHGAFEDRNPSPNFDTYFYRKLYSEYLDSHCPALLHYLKTGASLGLKPFPDHRIQIHVNDRDGTSAIGERGDIENTVKEFLSRSAIHIHIFYIDLLPELISYLRDLDIKVNVFVSTPEANSVELIETMFLQEGIVNNVSVRLVPNLGRDLAPLFVEFKDMWRNYEYILHLHTKKSPHTDFGDAWRLYLLENLLGSRELLYRIESLFVSNDELATIYPENFWKIKEFISFSGFEQPLENLFKRITSVDGGIRLVDDFPAGSMAWFRSSAYSSLVNAGLTYNDFESELGQLDGTLSHVLERMLTCLVVSQGNSIRTFSTFMPNPERYRQRLEQQGKHGSLDETSRWCRDTPYIARSVPLPLNPTSRYYNRRSLNIHWVIPDFRKGAGGHMTIFRMVSLLEKFGHRQTVWIQNARIHKTPEIAKNYICTHFKELRENVFVNFLPEDVGWLSGDIILATDCWTAYPVAQAVRFKERFYFIQDFEPFFHPMGELYLVAENTYRFGFSAVCAGQWLLEKAENYGMWAEKWMLCVDHACYYPNPDHGELEVSALGFQRPIRIAFYAREYTPRRAFRLGLLAFEELHRRGKRFEVMLFGQDSLHVDRSFPSHNLGVLPESKLGDLYRDCDIGVVFSTTNYSLVPLEMMACGLPVVELDLESTRSVFPSNVIAWTNADANSIADTLESLIDSEEQRNALSASGLEYAASLQWKDSAASLERSFLRRLDELGFLSLERSNLFYEAKRSTAPNASIVIPTFNAGNGFERVLARVLEQNTRYSFDVLIVDSGSSDGTINTVNKYGDNRVGLHRIPNEEFQHGRTRNLGVSLTEGEFVVFLTQDAIPVNDSWLENIINAFKLSENVAGVFGRHVAYDDASPFTKRAIEAVFNNFDRLPAVHSWSMDIPKHVLGGSQGWQQLLHFYSDNNSALRRSVWEKIAYPEVDWGEDQVWAWEIIRLGLSIGYAKDAVVMHSHNDSITSRYLVSRTEARFFLEHFGYRFFENGRQMAISLRNSNAEVARFGDELALSKCEINEQLGLNIASHLGRYLP